MNCEKLDEILMSHVHNVRRKRMILSKERRLVLFQKFFSKAFTFSFMTAWPHTGGFSTHSSRPRSTAAYHFGTALFSVLEIDYTSAKLQIVGQRYPFSKRVSPKI